jgi:gamma-glutamylcyclotransferase (GGCT)/AIG2-like uncharacterized protein YtfP
MKYDADGPQIAVQIFESDDLPVHWKRVDEFEGKEYRRTVVPVVFAGGEVKACYIYELNEDLFEDRSNHTA